MERNTKREKKKDESGTQNEGSIGVVLEVHGAG